MTLENQLTPVTKITMRKLPLDQETTEINIERDLGRQDGAKSTWQLFLSDDEMIQLEDMVSSYNRAFVDY